MDPYSQAFDYAKEDKTMNCQTTNGRFPDCGNLPKPRWRDALAALVTPATLVHRYRNLRSSAFYEAMHELDCKDKS